jgi:hypothetical protein
MSVENIVDTAVLQLALALQLAILAVHIELKKIPAYLLLLGLPVHVAYLLLQPLV